MNKGNKIAYRQGVLTYNTIHGDSAFYVKERKLFNKTEIKLTIAAGKNNYYFSIPKDTNLGDVSESGTVIAYMDCESGWLKFKTVQQEYSSIYKSDKPASGVVGEYMYHTNTPRGYVWSGSAWCPRDFVCIASYTGGAANTIPLVSQISIAPPYNTNIYGAKAAYPPKTNQNGHIVYSVQGGEVYGLEDTGQPYDDVQTILFSEGLECAEPITKNMPICINENGMVIKCTANNDFDCIGLSAYDVPTGGVLYGFIDFGALSNSAWSFEPNRPIFLDASGLLTQDSGINVNKYVKQIGTAMSKTSIQINLKQSVFINEN